MCRFCISDVQGLDGEIHHPGYDGGFTALVALLESLEHEPVQISLPLDYAPQPGKPGGMRKPYIVGDNVEDL